MNKLQLIIALVIIPMAWTGCGSDETDGTTETETQTTAERVTTISGLTADATNGASVYASFCAACHGASGEGVSSTPALTSLYGPTVSSVATVVIEGKGSMAGLGTSLTDQQIADVVGHVLSLGQ